MEEVEEWGVRGGMEVCRLEPWVIGASKQEVVRRVVWAIDKAMGLDGLA